MSVTTHTHTPYILCIKFWHRSYHASVCGRIRPHKLEGERSAKAFKSGIVLSKAPGYELETAANAVRFLYKLLSLRQADLRRWAQRGLEGKSPSHQSRQINSSFEVEKDRTETAGSNTKLKLLDTTLQLRPAAPGTLALGLEWMRGLSAYTNGHVSFCSLM